MKTYIGSACAKCGGTERYKSSSNCVPCAKALATARYELKVGGEPKRRGSRLARAEAKAQGLKTFVSNTACPHGHGFERTVRTGNCVGCLNKRHEDVERKKWIKEFRETEVQKIKTSLRTRRWRVENPERCTLNSSNKRAAKRRARVAWADRKAMLEVYRIARFISKSTGTPHHVDHVVPLVSEFVCGLHWEGNLRVLSASENIRKRNLHWPDMP